MKHKAIKAGIAAVALTGAVALAGPAAPASAAYADCGVGNYCLWTGSSYTGSRTQYFGPGSGYFINVGSLGDRSGTGRGVKTYRTTGAFFICLPANTGNNYSASMGSHNWNPTANGQCNF